MGKGKFEGKLELTAHTLHFFLEISDGNTKLLYWTGLWTDQTSYTVTFLYNNFDWKQGDSTGFFSLGIGNMFLLNKLSANLDFEEKIVTNVYN